MIFLSLCVAFLFFVYCVAYYMERRCERFSGLSQYPFIVLMTVLLWGIILGTSKGYEKETFYKKYEAMCNSPLTMSLDERLELDRMLRDATHEYLTYRTFTFWDERILTIRRIDPYLCH